MQFELIRSAKVAVQKMITAKQKPAAVITVNDKYQHTFSPKSRVSKHLELMETDELAQRLNGGHYFFIDGQLTRFRDGSYGNGFVHDDKTIDVLMDVIGVREINPRFGRRNARRDEDLDNKIELRKNWSDHNIVVPGYPIGGEFSSQLAFGWDPFVKTVNSTFELMRLICTNGAVGLTSWLNTKIPLFNRWHEHLDIASRQIQNRVNDTVIDRVQQMAVERASVANCLLVEQHCHDRLYSPTDKSDVADRERLQIILGVASPRRHLADYYTEQLFRDRTLNAQVPGHLTNFDLYNLATEVRSHTNECGKSSNNALDRLANALMFDLDRDYAVSSMSARKIAAFSSPERAFFGDLN